MCEAPWAWQTKSISRFWFKMGTPNKMICMRRSLGGESLHGVGQDPVHVDSMSQFLEKATFSSGRIERFSKCSTSQKWVIAGIRFSLLAKGGKNRRPTELVPSLGIVTVKKGV